MALFKKDKNKQFWDWFVKHEQAYYEFEKNQDKLFDTLSAQLLKVSKTACFEFSPKKKGKREFIISADGVMSEGLAIQNLVSAAPALSKFTVIAFRPRLGGGSIQLDGFELKDSDITFNHSFNEYNRVNILIHFGKNVDSKDIHAKGACFVLLDMIVGEYDMMTKVGLIDFATGKEAGLPKPQPITKLPEILDTRQPNELFSYK